MGVWLGDLELARTQIKASDDEVQKQQSLLQELEEQIRHYK